MPSFVSRRNLLRGLGSSLLVGPAALAGEEACAVGTTPSMVTGPFPPASFRPQAAGRANPGAILDVRENDLDLAQIKDATEVAKGQLIRIEVAVLAACAPVAGATVQLWQTDTDGNYNHKNERRTVTADKLDPNFGYWGSGTTDADGKIRLRTIVPAAYPAGSGWWRPPHLHWSIEAPELGRVTTQSFFDGDALNEVGKIREFNDADLILNYLQDFRGRLRGAALDEARRRAIEELKVRFEPGEDGVPEGKLVLRLA